MLNLGLLVHPKIKNLEMALLLKTEKDAESMPTTNLLQATNFTRACLFSPASKYEKFTCKALIDKRIYKSVCSHRKRWDMISKRH